MSKKHYEVLIIGGGISGAALAYELARYTDISSVGIVEKYEGVGTLNTKGTSNSQTIHFGDIETNYTAQKAKITKRTAKMVERYCLQHHYENEIIFSHQKMALGVGDEEVEFMLNRYEEFSELFPALEVWDKEKLKELEPSLVYQEDGSVRPENIVGVGSRGEWTTVDYEKMAISLIENAKNEPNTEVELFVNQEIKEIVSLKEGGYRAISQDGSEYSADFVVVDAGAHSLFLAHKMGYGLDYGCLPIAGSFYMTTQTLLNGKVYMVQNPLLPFAALHGDPDILAGGLTRFGPTALVLPKLERFKPGTYLDFWKTLRFDRNIVKIFWDLLKEGSIRRYIFKNFLFEIPGINKGLFVQDAKKIVPNLKKDDIEYAQGFGGVRPQVLNKTEKKLMLGEASIDTEKGIIFNMTPSPGATSCLGNAERDVRKVCDFLGKTFDEKRFTDELIEPESCVLMDPIEAQKKYASRLRDAIHAAEDKNYIELHDVLEIPDYWEEPYNPWVNRKDSWGM